jgi:Ni,Fe-hydrogenase III small subunit
MANWVLRGLRTGIRSTAFPRERDDTPGISPGRPVGAGIDQAAAERLEQICPTEAIRPVGRGVAIDQGRCVHCFRCHPDTAEEAAAPWDNGYEWAARADLAGARNELERFFRRSLHIRMVDAGACGACMSEARQLANPYYNLHRLGFFITPTPRNADILLVAGPVTDAMRIALLQTWEAMPTPKRVVAIGACAITGGVFGPSFAAAGGAAEIIPVDVVVPGCPPPPLAILHAFLTVVGRKPPAPLTSWPEERP